MKATLVLTSSNASCLLATVKTFDISKPIYSISLRRLQKTLDGNCIEMNNYFNGIDAPLAEKNGDDLTEPLNKKNDNQNTTSSTYSVTGLTPAELSTTYSKMLLDLSPEHLILIRLLLLLKFFAARSKFKEAFKPYDFKDVIEQYTQGKNNSKIIIQFFNLIFSRMI